MAKTKGYISPSRRRTASGGGGSNVAAISATAQRRASSEMSGASVQSRNYRRSLNIYTRSYNPATGDRVARGDLRYTNRRGGAAAGLRRRGVRGATDLTRARRRGRVRQIAAGQMTFLGL